MYRYRDALPAPGESHFGSLNGTLFMDASIDLAEQYQVPLDMAGLTLIGTIATMAQGRYDVELPHGSITPLSLFTMIVIDSGEGKTVLKKKILAALVRLQAQQHNRFRNTLSEHLIQLESWKVKGRSLKTHLHRAETKNDNTQEALEAFNAHQMEEPVTPREFRLLYQNTTPEALFLGLRDILPTAGLITDEGDTFFRSAMNRAKGHLNSLWDGDDIVVSRASKEDIVVYGARFSLQVGIQPRVLARHLKPEDRDSGWAARFLICAPMPKRGTRHYTLNDTVAGEYWQQADQRLEQMARENLVLLDDPERPRDIVRFSQKAKEKWVQLANEIERAMGPGQRFQACPDHASKLTNNIGRVAALLHLFERYEGEISEQTLSRATHMCCYFSDHFQQVMMPPPQDVQDAMLLDNWFDELRRYGHWYIPYNHARQSGPNPLRSKKRLKEAIDVLLFDNRIMLFSQGKTRMINLLPHQQPPVGGHPPPPQPPQNFPGGV